jgi:hypothetical protein
VVREALARGTTLSNLLRMLYSLRRRPDVEKDQLIEMEDDDRSPLFNVTANS